MWLTLRRKTVFVNICPLLLVSGAPILTVCEREGRNEMEEQEANDQNKSPEAPRDYKLPEACNFLDVQMKDSDWLETWQQQPGYDTRRRMNWG